jgi:hypothetical protein
MPIWNDMVDRGKSWYCSLSIATNEWRTLPTIEDDIEGAIQDGIEDGVQSGIEDGIEGGIVSSRSMRWRTFAVPAF